MGRRRKTKCLVCDDAAECRGLCSADYQAARYAIKTGATTEAELIASGSMLPRFAKPRSHLREHLFDVVRRRRAKSTTPPIELTPTLPLLTPAAMQ